MEGIIIYLTERLQNPFSTLFIILMIKLSKSRYFYIFYFLAFIQENNYLYGIPGAAFLASYAYAVSQGYPEVHTMGYLGSSLCCVGALVTISQL